MIQKNDKENFDNFDWLNYLAARNKHKVFDAWKYNQELFWDKYFILNDDEYLIILDKHNYLDYKFAKSIKSFVIEFDRREEKEEIKEKKIFSIGNIDIVKKEVV